ncbi:plastidal glycolate glycerate translocator, chloroplastic [Raphidocelis subcapitata]|uniref:Plastidal glycolate glycerate translocator, chloroplastic n=1 Tax=Raphidocelis subcapitata TaxID=307507 RepID=A0A2V0NRY9_9CHLO|nr:plastidal glycolate glycerate translocator, chloroplastic [Raphidocelis subcapitata]|eukprot:GBF88340.1 plastidal glycolate glycerate translocator, chloroplastic [Raphidocelis subcapitata]
MLAQPVIRARPSAVRTRPAQIGGVRPARLARNLRLAATPSDPAGSLSGAFDDLAAKGKEAAKDAAAAASSAAETVKEAAADATAAAQAAAQQLADQATAALDKFASEMTSSAGDLKSKASGSAESALSAFDAFAETAVVRMRRLSSVMVPGDAEAKSKVDSLASSFTATADNLRQEVVAGTKSGAAAIDELASAVTAKASEMHALVLGVASSAAKKAGVEIDLPVGNFGTPGLVDTVKEYLQLWVGLGSLFYLDQTIKGALVSAGIKFPSALAGMFGVFALLCLVGDKSAGKILGIYGPALNWIARWLPLFYVPALVTLPLALTGIPGGDLARIVGILLVGMVATLLFTAQVAVVIREAVKTPVKPVPKGKPAPPFETGHYVAWGTIAVLSLVGAVFGAPDLAASMALPFGLAATVGGFLIGNLVPGKLQGVLHPVVVTALIANAGAALYGAVRGLSYDVSQKVYLAKGAGPLGAGDLLMSLLGVVIVSFGFRVYTQRDTMKRHFPEIVGATVLSSAFSLFSTAFAAKALGLAPDLARALIPRSVTVALALPIAQSLEAPLAITAAAVLLQGILGANFGPGLMTRVGIKDTIARGLAAAATAGGLGTASLTSKEPEALPFCALSYALVGIFSTLIMSLPPVLNFAISIVG